eukprot:178598-Amphidinium_carterae.1
MTAARAASGAYGPNRRRFNCRVTNLPMVPVTIDVLIKIAALFKVGVYRSWPNYLGAVKKEYPAGT